MKRQQTLKEKRLKKNQKAIENYFENDSKNQEKQMRGVSMIPIAIKLYYLRDFLKSKVHDFTVKIKKYREECQEIDKINNQQLWKHEVLQEPKIRYPVKPKLALCTDLISDQDIIELIHVAEKNRVNWNNIITSENQDSFKSYYQKSKYTQV